MKQLIKSLAAVSTTVIPGLGLLSVPAQAIEPMRVVDIPAATTPCSAVLDTQSINSREHSDATGKSELQQVNPACVAVAGWQRTCSTTGQTYARSIWVKFKSGTNPCKGSYLVLRRNDGKMNRVVDTRTYKSLNEWCGKRPFDCSVATGGAFFIAGLLIGPWYS